MLDNDQQGAWNPINIHIAGVNVVAEAATGNKQLLSVFMFFLDG